MGVRDGSALGLPEGVGGTGYSIACARAAESRRADRLFEDPYAGLFEATGPGVAAMYDLEAHTQREIEDLISFGVVTAFAFAVRTRFFDDFLLEASATCPQVVLVAAGLDARVFRLAWPSSTCLFEVDLPTVLDFKDEVLAPTSPSSTCTRTIVRTNLAEDWQRALVDAGFDPATPTAWLAEGLMLYLTDDQAKMLLSTIAQMSAPGSQLAFEHGPYSDDELLGRVSSTKAIAPQAATWLGGLKDEPEIWLHEQGWSATTFGITDVGAAFGRQSPPHVVVDLITATRC